MNTLPIIPTLEKSKISFLQKDLKVALDSAKVILNQAKENKSIQQVISSKIFISKIYGTIGHFGGDNQYFFKAFEVLDTIDESLIDKNEILHFFLAKSEIYLLKIDVGQAQKYAELALQKGQKENNISGIVQSLLAKVQVFILKNQFSEAAKLTNKSLTLLKGIEKPILKAKAYNLLCKIRIKQQDYNKILEYGEEVLSISQAHGDIEKEIIATSNLGIYYATNLDYKSAIEYFYSSLEKSKTIQFDRQTAQNLINLGTIYARLFNPKESLSNYQAVVEKYDQVLVDTTKTIIFNNIGNIHFEEKSYKESKKHFQKSLALAEKIQYTEMIALALAHLGKLSCAENDFETAMSFSDRANELLEDLGDVNAKSINVLNFAKLAHHSGDFEIAILHLKEGVEISKKVRNEENEIACYRLLAEFYKDKKDFENAFQFKSLYAEKQEDYLKKQRNRQILDQEITFATREKEQQIEALTQANQLQAMLLKKQEEVERANEQLTQVNEELKQFAYVASHDLKEPLRMIGSYTQIINRKYASDIDDNTQAYFHYVTDGVERMNNLLDGLLKYATVGRGAQELKVINLNDTLLICQANLRLLIEETNTKLEVDELPSILGISSLLSQLFQNLILNAIKFRNKDTFPEISIKSEEREKEYLIAIKDNGIGIKEEYKERIFVIFQRLHAQTDYEGTGIGLAICHKIMQRMGGKIWVDSEYGNGSTFFFTFPKPMGISNKVIES
ncbi:ATP-binding protein [bacterium]|nr:ATP-binding protein [Saprospiraceae bacterium]MDC3253313.1 ATP-binding protein [bacterium]MDG1435506.1 ATP-binding protein [Saprospiraceae bacterium]